MPDNETEEKLRQLAALGVQRADLAWLFYLSGDGNERREADELLDILLFQLARKDYSRQVFLDPPDPERCEGSYQLGDVLYPPGDRFSSFGLRESEWTRHMLIVGMTGVGKTTLAYHLLDELRRHDKPFLVFDWKRNYRDLLQLPRFRNTTVFTIGQDIAPFRFNPLIPPPGVDAGEWLMKLVDVLKHAYFVGEGVEYLLRRAIDYVYAETGFHDDRRGHPTFLAVRDFVFKQRLQGRMSLWKASAMRVLESLCFRHGLGPVVNARAEDFAGWLDKNVILELDALSDSDKVFLTEAIILWIYEYRKRHAQREVFQHALVIEEAHHVLNEHKERAEGVETIMETCLRQIREFGESVIVIDQEPSKLSHSIKANTYTKIVFNLGNGRDIDDVSRSLGLSEEEREYIKLLDVGKAIVAQKGRVITPIHVAFPHLPVRKGLVGDEQIRGVPGRSLSARAGPSS